MMALSHGKKTVITVATKDLSSVTKNSNLEESGDLHDGTGYAPAGDDRIFAGGLRTTKFTMSGVYDTVLATSPRGVFRAKTGTTLACVRKPEGTGTGLPNEAFSAVCEKYVETEPFDDLVTWSADLTVTGTVAITVQP